MALTIGQEKCVNTLDKPLAVSAGAGSGKTFTLTRRIVHALESGYLTDIDQVLAITFTSKAAGEIKSRVKGALRAGGMAEQALKTDEAWISTIHGMCSRILRAHALELGLDPAFKVADEATVRTLLDASLEEVLGGRDDLVTVAEGVSPQRLDALFASFDVHPAGPRTASVEGMVRQLVEAASAHPDGMASVVAPPEAPSPIKLLAQLVDVAETAYDLADGVKPGSTRDKFLAATQDALEGARELIGRGSDGLTYRRALSAMNGFPVPGRNFGKNTPYGEQAAELAEQYFAIAAQARCGLVQEQLATLIDVARSVADAFARRKREARLLDNNDLLAFASRAFRDHPAIQAAYADRFKLVMVDEFQDTDQLQVDMIKRMAGEGFSRMCTVGDAQQSIYRFRGADVSVYRRHLEDVRRRNPEGIIELPDNFRSHGDVLALCDRIFEQPQVFGAEFMSLAPGRAESKVKCPFLPDGPRVQVQVTVTPSRGVASADAAGVWRSRSPSSRRPGTGRATWWCCSAAWAVRTCTPRRCGPRGCRAWWPAAPSSTVRPRWRLWFAWRRPSRIRSGPRRCSRCSRASCSPCPPMICWSCPRAWTRSAVFLAGGLSTRAFAISSTRWRRGARSRRRLRRAQA